MVRLYCISDCQSLIDKMLLILRLFTSSFRNSFFIRIHGQVGNVFMRIIQVIVPAAIRPSVEWVFMFVLGNLHVKGLVDAMCTSAETVATTTSMGYHS